MSKGAFVDEAFEGCGQEPGLEIWRIEKLKVVKQDPKTYGKFYSGDSYICLLTRKVENRIEWDIHFWLGAETSQDEAGVCAYKTVELDDSLGGYPVQYREVQKHESKRFLDIFPLGVEYLEGGIDSGFVKVDRDAYRKRLLHVKGKRNIRIEEVELTYKSLNHGDVFVLDDGKTIYCWNGKDSSKRERVKAAEIARKIKDDERGGKPRVILIDSGHDNENTFFKVLGDKGPIKSAEEGGDDVEHDSQDKVEVCLYRVSDASGELKIEEAAKKPLKKEDLDTDDCFILDTGPAGVFSWIGKGCTINEKKAAMNNAMKFIHKKGYPSYTTIMRILEGGETPLFKSYFATWATTEDQLCMGVIDKSNIAAYNTSKFNVNSLHGGKKKDKSLLPDDGKGKVKIWRIEKFKKMDLPEKEYGVFYDGDCYVILYTYQVRSYEKYIIYYWQGLKSSSDEKGSSAIIAAQIDDELGGSAVQVRVVQNKEPEHFCLVFHGKMIIRKGGIDSGFRKRSDSESEKTKAKDGVILFQIRGTTELNTRAVEVTGRAASLNSNDVFLMKTPDKAFVWEGSGASEDEKKFAENVSDYAAPDGDLVIVREGKETDEFWSLLGGKEEYASMPRLAEDRPEVPPRLFQCSNASGKFWVEEIFDFDQDDLCEDDVMFLDTYDEIFVWIGDGANFIEKKNALEGAVEYLKSDTNGRTPENTSILQVKQGCEPLNFTGYFLAWDTEKWSKGMTYEELKKQMGEDNAGVTSVEEELQKYNKVYPYSALCDHERILDGVDPCNKEKHLSDAEFEQYMKCTKAEYDKMKPWKREIVKRRANLF
ncbi:gelsolin, cytoplasmic-like [Clytia hemisphaerica]|uniref:HP domain-containing protein n=1 Tax=Clytia hemisphaerica TaxID=252671 RepID=A0A7M6DKY4_9CNID